MAGKRSRIQFTVFLSVLTCITHLLSKSTTSISGMKSTMPRHSALMPCVLRRVNFVRRLA
jgi:hypothetical protein